MQTKKAGKMPGQFFRFLRTIPVDTWWYIARGPHHFGGNIHHMHRDKDFVLLHHLHPREQMRVNLFLFCFYPSTNIFTLSRIKQRQQDISI